MNQSAPVVAPTPVGIIAAIQAASSSIITTFHMINRTVRMADSLVAAAEVHAAYLHETSLEDVADKRTARAALRASLALPAA